MSFGRVADADGSASVVLDELTVKVDKPRAGVHAMIRQRSALIQTHRKTTRGALV